MKGFYYEASKPRNAAFSPSVTSLLAVGIRKYALLHHYLTALCLISISSVWWWNKFLLVWFYRVSHLISVSTYLNNYIYSFLFFCCLNLGSGTCPQSGGDQVFDMLIYFVTTLLVWLVWLLTIIKKQNPAVTILLSDDQLQKECNISLVLFRLLIHSKYSFQ